MNEIQTCRDSARRSGRAAYCSTACESGAKEAPVKVGLSTEALILVPVKKHAAKSKPESMKPCMPSHKPQG